MSVGFCSRTTTSPASSFLRSESESSGRSTAMATSGKNTNTGSRRMATPYPSPPCQPSHTEPRFESGRDVGSAVALGLRPMPTHHARRCLLVVLLAATGALAAPYTGGAPYFFVKGAEDAESFPLESTDVAFTVSGVIADFTVTQTYRNRGEVPLHAKYVFPASTRAAVHGLTMKLDDRTIVAKVKERGEARAEFERARQQGRSASLLEQDRPNVFQMNVANILPGERVQVVLRYSELLVPTEGVYELVYPTVVGPRYDDSTAATPKETASFTNNPTLHAGEAPPSTLSLHGALKLGMPPEELGSQSHRLVLKQTPTGATLALHDSEAQGGNRDFILRFRLRGDEVRSGLLLSDDGDEKFFLLMVQPPRRVEPTLMPPREFVFIVDVSGSMHGFPLETAKHLLRELAATLRPQDTFNVLLFSGDSRLLSPQSVPATPENVRAAMRVLEDEVGGGGTELRPALKRALTLGRGEGRSRSFVVITDGYISAEKELFDTIREHLHEANVFSFGIGSSVNRYLVEGVAKAGQGEPFIIERAETARDEARRFAAYVQSPVLTDVKLEARGVTLFDVEPSAVPDVLADRPVIISGKWRGEQKGALVLSGVTGQGPWQQRFDLAQADTDNPALRFLWARSRISTLSDFGRGEETATREEVTRLGLRYNLLTRFTSFIAVTEEVRAARPGVEVKQPLPMPDGVEDSALGTETGPEPGLWAVLLLALGLAAATHARRVSVGRRA